MSLDSKVLLRIFVHKKLFPNRDSESMGSIQILSDLHLEAPMAYDTFEITPKAPHLALLGHIGNPGRESHKDKMFGFLNRQLRASRTLFFVPGNHEAYHSTWPATLSALEEFKHDADSRRKEDTSLGIFVLMNRASFMMGERVLILGCSLFSLVPPERFPFVETGLNDFYQISSGWDVEEHNAAHKRDLEWLNEQAERAEQDPSVRTVVILTHWSPSVDDRAIEPRHKGSDI